MTITEAREIATQALLGGYIAEAQIVEAYRLLSGGEDYDLSQADKLEQYADDHGITL